MSAIRYTVTTIFGRALWVFAVFSLVPAIGILLLARSSSRGALVWALIKTEPIDAAKTGLHVVGASLLMAIAIAATTLLGWTRKASHSWIRSGRLGLTFWVAGFLLFPGFASRLPVLRGWPFAVVMSSLLAGSVALYLHRSVRPSAKECVLIMSLTTAFFFSPPAPRVNVRALAGREFGRDDVLLIGFDSISYLDGKEVLAKTKPTYGVKTVYDNAWTPIAGTSGAWRTAFTGTYPSSPGVLPGGRWPVHYEHWLPRELARVGYRVEMFQDDPTTNIFGHSEWVNVPHKQGWRFVMTDFAWRALFPLSTVGGQWWMSLLGGPYGSATRYAYRPDWFKHDALVALGRAAKKGRVLWAQHSCFVHAPVHLSLSEAWSIPRWWWRSPAALEGSGNEFTDSETRGRDEVLEARMTSARGVLREWLNELVAQGIYGKSLVVLFSDHGPRGDWISRDRTEHIMLALVEPGVAGSVTVGRAVSLVDIASTVRSYLGLEGVASDGIPLPRDNSERRSARGIGRINAASLTSTKIDLRDLSGARISSRIRFEEDGTYVFSPEFLVSVAAGENGPASGSGTQKRWILSFVDRD
jgi:uncharacterized membrane protein (UPF0136 family)